MQLTLTVVCCLQAGNAVTQGRDIVVFPGSSQALLAAIHALSDNATAGAAVSISLSCVLHHTASVIIIRQIRQQSLQQRSKHSGAAELPSQRRAEGSRSAERVCTQQANDRTALQCSAAASRARLFSCTLQPDSPAADGSFELWSQSPYCNGYPPLATLFTPAVTWASDNPEPRVRQDNVIEIVCRCAAAACLRLAVRPSRLTGMCAQPRRPYEREAAAW